MSPVRPEGPRLSEDATHGKHLLSPYHSGVSENALTVVEISLTGAEARARASEIREWLLGTGVIKPNPRLDPIDQPSEFAPGDAVRTATPDYPDAWDGTPLANNGVDIITTREVHHPIENYEPPNCPSCDAPLDGEFHQGLIEPWLKGPEPVVHCQSCGVATPLGDWPGEWTFQVGELAVRFNNWPPISDEFINDVGRRLGARWRVVIEHS
jgi:hypothetical protein